MNKLTERSGKQNFYIDMSGRIQKMDSTKTQPYLALKKISFKNSIILTEKVIIKQLIIKKYKKFASKK